jgi:hypothetical protein
MNQKPVQTALMELVSTKVKGLTEVSVQARLMANNLLISWGCDVCVGDSGDNSIISVGSPYEHLTV